MPDKAWKQAERRLAKHFGATRNALSGSNSKLSASDSTHPTLYLESKQRADHAVWTVYLDAKEKAKKEGKTPIVGLFKKRSPGVLLCIHSDDIEVFVCEWLRANNGHSRILAGTLNITDISHLPPATQAKRKAAQTKSSKAKIGKDGLLKALSLPQRKRKRKVIQV